MGLMQQFAHPHGISGRLVGRLMALFNADQVKAVVRTVAPVAGEHILEIGFGPGVGLAALATTAPRAQVSGIDPSRDMVAASQHRCRQFGDRVQPREGSADALPWPDASFDAVCSTNSVQLWRPRDASLAEVLRVLRPGGRLVLGVHERAVLPQGRRAGRTFHDTLVPQVTAAGFTDISWEWQPAKPGVALLLQATRPT